MTFSGRADIGAAGNPVFSFPLSFDSGGSLHEEHAALAQGEAGPLPRQHAPRNRQPGIRSRRRRFLTKLPSARHAPIGLRIASWRLSGAVRPAVRSGPHVRRPRATAAAAGHDERIRHGALHAGQVHDLAGRPRQASGVDRIRSRPSATRGKTCTDRLQGRAISNTVLTPDAYASKASAVRLAPFQPRIPSGVFSLRGRAKRLDCF